MKLLGASIGSCVHNVGLLNFLKIAEQNGYEVIYAGAAVPLERFVEQIKDHDPEVVAISYRLSAESLRNLLNQLEDLLKEHKLTAKTYIFGGTIETAQQAKEFSFIKKVFDGTEEIDEVVMFLRGKAREEKDLQRFPQTLRERVDFKAPFPLIRHHIGLQTLEETIEEIEKLADSELLDIISIAPDQNCQQFFFEPEKMDHSQDGAGGAPIRTREDFVKLYQATRRGNYPLVRCYAGTTHMVEFSKLLKETINNAWAAIPLMWYSDLDRRSTRPLLQAIKENIEGIKWNAQNDVPVEVTDSHQWALRVCHDAVEVATAYLAAFAAKRLGVKDYVQQFMLETPNGLSPRGDIAKMLAKRELVESLSDENFRIYRMVRTGLMSVPADPYAAMGQLSVSMFYGWSIEPHIVHVVAYCESMKRATSKEIVESVKMSKRSINLAIRGMPDPLEDEWIRNEKDRIKDEAMLIIESIKHLKDGKDEDILDPETLYRSVEVGILDAPALKGFSVAKGKVKTQIIDGLCRCVDDEGKIVPEKERLKSILGG